MTDIDTTRSSQALPGEPIRTGNALLLAQLGTHAATAFAERIATLDLTPAQAGLLRLVASEAGQSQRAIAAQLGTPPSRLVLLLDDLESRGLIERRRNPADRRNHALHLTANGGRLLGQLARSAATHEDAICAALDPDERQLLAALLGRIAADQGLEAGIHPGYRHLPR
jgi:DNA-binding MarR family transcriptional regulator